MVCPVRLFPALFVVCGAGLVAGEAHVCVRVGVTFYLISRYMRPEGPWQQRWAFYMTIFLV